MVALCKSGLLCTEHVLSRKQKQIQLCGNDNCWSFTIKLNLNPAIERWHLKAATLATSDEIVELQQEHLNQLVIKVISEKTKE